MSEPKPSFSLLTGAEPGANRSAAPMWIIVLTLTLLFLGAVYFDHHSGWFDARIYGPFNTAEQLEAYQPKSGAAAALAHGKQVYESVCGICHGPDGLGKPGQAPPLAGSEWVTSPGLNRLAHIPLEGLNGPIQVKGNPWNMAMAAMGAALPDEDLASVLSYIRSTWGNHAGPITADDLKKVRASIGKNPAPANLEQLKAMPE